MECLDTQRLIDAYLDRELPAARAAELETHLAACSSCRREYGPLVTLLCSPAPVSPSAGLRDRIVEAVRSESESHAARPVASPRRPAERHAHWILSPWVGAVAASLCFFVMGWGASQWWRKPAVGPTVVENVPPAPQPSAVALSPWLAGSLAQAMTAPALGNPMPLMAQALVTELASRPEESVTAADRGPRRAESRPTPRSDETMPPAELLLLPALYRSLGV